MSSPCFVRHTGTAADLYDVHGQRLPMQSQGNSSDLLLTVQCWSPVAVVCL
jgi:hypothetical protein